VNYALGTYVPVPETGKQAVKSITNRQDMSIEVKWKDEDEKVITGSLGLFESQTKYLAEITLEAKQGYFFEDTRFTYPNNGDVNIDPGKSTETDSHKRILFVEYPETEPAGDLIEDYDLGRYIPQPEVGNRPARDAFIDGVNATAVWKKKDGGGWTNMNATERFLLEGLYQAEITLTPGGGYVFENDVPFEYAQVYGEAPLYTVLAKSPFTYQVKVEFTPFILNERVSKFGVNKDVSGSVMKVLYDERTAAAVVITIDGSGGQESLNGSNGYRLNADSSPLIVTIDGGGWRGKIASQRPFLRVERGMTVTLKNLEIEGITNNTFPLIQVDAGGTLNLENVTLTKNTNTVAGLPVLSGMNQAGGIAIAGTTVMKGGTVSSNTGAAGGVVIYSGGRFTITDGSITGNTGKQSLTTGSSRIGVGGVYIEEGGEFLMDGSASVSSNAAEGTGNSVGGVYVLGSGTFTMDGGTIAGNTNPDMAQPLAVNGPGESADYFTMNGAAKIDANNFVGKGMMIRVVEPLTQRPAANFVKKDDVIENDTYIYLLGNIADCYMNFQIGGEYTKDGDPIIRPNGTRR
jgi:hypothetical protein